MAVLRIDWGTTGRVAPAESKVVTASDGDDGKTGGDGAKEAPAAPIKRADKPLLVYVAEPGVVDASFDKVEKVVLTDDKVVIGTWAFKCIRISPEQAAQDPILKEAGKETPRIVFISTDYKEVKVIEGSKLGVGGLWSEMQAQFKKAYTGDLEKNVKALLKVLNEFDKIANQRKVLDAEKERADKPTPAEQAKWKKEAEELDATEKKANAKRDELMKFEKKEAAAA